MAAFVLLTRPAWAWIVTADLDGTCRQSGSDRNNDDVTLVCSKPLFSDVEFALSRIESGLPFRDTALELGEEDGIAIQIFHDRPQLMPYQASDGSSHWNPERAAVQPPRRPQSLGDRQPDHLVALTVVEPGEDPTVDLGQRAPVQIHQELTCLHVYIGNSLHMRVSFERVCARCG